jgi:hypothetical protein
VTSSIWKLDQTYAQQNRNELEILLEQHLKGVKSILEVGSCFGRTLEAMAEVAAPGALLRVIDLGELPDEAGPYKGFDLRSSLVKIVQQLADRGFDIKVGFGNSHDPALIDWVRQWAPYDFVLIDAGHTEDDVFADWQNYGGMGRLVGFHDIVNPDLGVGTVWRAITSELVNREHYREIVCPMGIGVMRGGAYGT